MEKEKMEIMRKTAEQIKYFRKAMGFSQKSLALAAGLDPAFLGHIERCLKCPTIDTLNKIANGLNISLSQLLDFDNRGQINANEEIIQNITALVCKLPEEDAKQLQEIIKKIVEFKRKDSR